MTKQMNIDDFQTAVHTALRAWGNLAGTTDDLLEDLYIIQHERAGMNGDSPTNRRLAANQVLLNGIQLLQKQDPTGAKILSLRFMNDETVLMVAGKLNLSEDQVKRRQQKALHRLAQILWQQETAVRENHRHTLEARLPPPSYTQLIGFEPYLTELNSYLTSADAPGVIAIVGIGGIGKTALADQAVRAIIPQFIYQDVLWPRINPEDEAASAHDPQSTLEKIINELADTLCPNLPPASAARVSCLRQSLKSRPALVVIDNLESEADTAFILDALNDWALPSKFLLTTRVRLPASSLVRSLFLDEMPLPAAADLIRHQAQTLNLPDLAQAATDSIAPIYAVTGGNPLAIKLVVGLTAVLPLPQILTDLTAAQITEIEQLYRHIYWQAWHSLSENGQTLIEMMPMAAGVGIKPEQMAAISGLSAQQLWPAVTELVNRSLLEVRGTAWERRYGIHRLTESFLRTEIIHWPDVP